MRTRGARRVSACCLSGRGPLSRRRSPRFAGFAWRSASFDAARHDASGRRRSITRRALPSDRGQRPRGDELDRDRDPQLGGEPALDGPAQGLVARGGGLHPDQRLVPPVAAAPARSRSGARSPPPRGAPPRSPTGRPGPPSRGSGRRCAPSRGSCGPCVRPQAQGARVSEARSWVRKRTTGMASRVSVVTTSSPTVPSGTGARVSGSITSTRKWSSATWSPAAPGTRRRGPDRPPRRGRSCRWPRA